MENKPTSITSGVTSLTGLVAAFAYNEGTGSTVSDASGNNNGGTLTGGYTWTSSGKYGAGLTFDGTTSYGMIAALAPSLQFTNAMTVEVWMNAATLPTGWHTLISRQFGTSFQDSWGLFTRGTNVEFYAGSTDFVAAPITVGQWYHVAGVIDGPTIRVYINGVLIATGTTTVPIPNDANEVVIGASSNGNPQISEFFNGMLDEIRVYNRALSQAEIQTDMNTPITTSPSGLVAAYGFNEGAGTTAADTSGTSSAATLTNVAWAAQGKYGPGLTFDGTSSYGQIPPPATPLRLTTAMTVEVWMNATTLATGWHSLMSRQFGTGGADSWGLFTRGTNVEFWTNSTDFIAAPVTSGTWTHVAGVLDGTAVRLYVNGMLVATGTTTVPIPNDDNEVVMGASSNGNPQISEFFNGTLDEIRVYNRALSQAEIQTDMNTPVTTTLSGSITTTFVYDGEGGRVKKSVGATMTRYISPLYECDNTNCSRYIWAGATRLAMVPDNPTGQPCNPACYFNADHLGSTNLVTDATGARVETLAYQPYGELTTDSPGTPVNTAYKYTGQARDASTGLLYYQARYYDPRLGRFLSPDTLVSRPGDPQDFNRYTYAGNNPLLYTDPTGHLKIGKFFHRLFDKADRFIAHNAWARALGWAILPAYMMHVDFATRDRVVAAGAGFLVGGPIGGFYGAVAGGAASGFVSAGLGDSNLLRGAGIGALTGAVGYGAGFVGSGLVNPDSGSYLAQIGKGAFVGALKGTTISLATNLAEGRVDTTSLWRAAAIGGALGAVRPIVVGRDVTDLPSRSQNINYWQQEWGQDFSGVAVKEGGLLNAGLQLTGHGGIALGGMINLETGGGVLRGQMGHELWHVVQEGRDGLGVFWARYLLGGRATIEGEANRMSGSDLGDDSP